MKLRFSIFLGDLRERRAEITALILQVLPGALVSVDEMNGILEVTLPQGVDPALATETICRALADIGITARPVTADPTGYPPIHFKAKKARSVPLSAFIVSLIAVALVVAMLTFFFSGALSSVLFGFGGYGDTLGTGDQEGEDYAGKIALIDSIFEEYSLYDTDGELLLDQMLKAYAAATGDTYAAYYTAEEFAQLLADNHATTVGIGISAIEDSEQHNILVINVFPDSPAEEAGVRPGDRIAYIGTGDGRESVVELGYEVAVNRLRGEAGTTAEFVVVRDGAELDFSIVRAAVQTVSVTGKVSQTNASVGVVSITQFDTATPAQFKSVMQELLDQHCTRFVFDVRNNPGGDLKSISAVLSYFLNENDTILSTVQKDGTTTVYRVKEVSYTDDYEDCSVSAEEIGMYRDYPIAVLTNGATASAAELFTAALRDYELADIVGKTTYGKGILQTIYSLEPWGYSGGIKLTVGYYNPPSGENYDGVGIAPDVEVSLSEEAAKINPYLLSEGEDAQLLAAIQNVISK